MAKAYAYVGAKALIFGGFVRERVSVVKQYARNFWEKVKLVGGYRRVGLERLIDRANMLRAETGRGRSYERMEEVDLDRSGVGEFRAPTGRGGGATGTDTPKEEERESLVFEYDSDDE